MIKASHQQTKTKKSNFSFHKEVSRKRFWERKLLYASIITAGLVFILWILGVPVVYRIAIFLIAFLGSFAIRVKANLNWAFSWIAASIGLSYETALELNQNDPYKLNEGVIRRAETLSLKLEKPQQNLWWLPVLALAIGFALLPFSPFKSNNLWTTLVTNPSNNFTNDPETNSKITQDIEEAQLEENPDISGLNRDAPNNDNEINQEQNEGLSDGVSEDQALSEYLDNINQREKPSETKEPNQSQAQNPFNSVQNPPADSSNTQNTSAKQQQEGDGQNQEGQQSQNSSQSSSPNDQNQQQGNDEQRQGGSSSEAQEQGENQQNKSGQDSQEQSQPEAQQDSQDKSNQKQEDTENAESQDNSPQQSTDANDPESDQSLGAGDKGKDGVDKDPSDTIEGNSAIDRIQVPQNQPDFLEGQLYAGESSQAGTVRLSGSNQNKGSNSANNAIFNRSQEEAISEGSIPLEYQEIVRNYFR